MSKFFSKHGATLATTANDKETDGPVTDLDEGSLYLVRQAKRQIGVTSAVFLIFNSMIGTGIFATPSAIFSLSGSIGLCLFIWVAGMLIAAAGMTVYSDLAPPSLVTAVRRITSNTSTASPDSWPRDSILDTSSYLDGQGPTPWSLVNISFMLREVNRWNQRGVGLACITTAFLIHGLALKLGLRLQNLLGIIKLLIILLIVVSGWVALGGGLKIDKPHNFDHAFEGTTGSAYGVVTALYNVIWNYIGYSNANYALSETKNPVRTLKLAAPLALGSIAILYMFVNIAYFAAVPAEEIISSKRLVAASLFRNVFGTKAERALSVFVALSAFGNVLSVIFSQGRLVQELGREGILPFSRIWASNRPFNAPLTGLFEHWLVSVIIMLAPPPGYAYNFVLNVISYPLAVVNVFVAGALIHLYLNRSKWNWHHPISASMPVAIFFLFSNIYIVVRLSYHPQTDKAFTSHCLTTFTA
ncbi:methionine permease [Neocucurbitaria cava]|uniref:Methionine permease n=1 Tax=Neocucurbitaria cava TaxID=798079 RepID=A0A9W8Y1V2_9PLEO|nr:methionine permease [Neocucurbitaria cava]